MASGGRYECFHCCTDGVGWEADFDTADFGGEPGGLVQICSCANCGAEIYYVFPPVEEEDDDEPRG